MKPLIKPALCLGLVISILIAIKDPDYWVRTTSAYSGKTVWHHFVCPPTEAELFRATYLDDFGQARLDELDRTGNGRLFVKTRNGPIALWPRGGDDDSPDTVFADGTKLPGRWLSEPSTRFAVNPLCGQVLYGIGIFLIAFPAAFCAFALLRRGWVFLLNRISELARAVRATPDMMPHAALATKHTSATVAAAPAFASKAPALEVRAPVATPSHDAQARATTATLPIVASPRGTRLLAKAADVLIVFAVLWVVRTINPNPGLLGLLVIFLWPVMNFVSVWQWGASPGKLLLHLRVTDVHGQPCGPVRALFRALLEFCYFIPLVGLICLIALLCAKDGRSPLDHTVKTRVVVQ